MGLFTTSTLRKFAYGILNSMSGILDSWEQDDSILDSQIDNVRFKIGKDGKKYKLIYYRLEVEKFGIQTFNTPDQNDAAFLVMMNKGINRERLLFGRGTYQFNSTLVFLDIFVSIEGVSMDSTTLSFPAACLGIHTYRSNEERVGNLKLRHLKVQARGQVTNDGTLAQGETEPNFQGNNNARIIFYADRKQYHGVFIESVSTIEYVEVNGFSGHQIRTNGNTGSVGTDASLAKILHCKVSAGGRYRPDGTYLPGYGGCGIYSTGGDGNAIYVEACDARDNPQVGFLDASFLGNNYDSCHASENGFGHYINTDPNAATVIDKCYGEGGSPVSSLTPKSSRFGGLHGNGIIGGGNYQGNTIVGKLNFGNMVISETTMEFNGYNGTGTFSLVDTTTPDNPSAKRSLRNPSSDDRVSVMDWVAPNTLIPVSNSKDGDIMSESIAVAFRDPYINGRKQQVSNTFPDFTDLTLGQKPGFTIINNGLRGSTVPRAWIVSSGGYINTMTYTENYKASSTQVANILQLSAPTSILRIGDYIIINGKTSPIVGFTKDLTRFNHIGPDEFFDQQGGALITLADGSLIPGTTSAIRVSQANPANTQCLVTQPLPETLAIGTILRVRYSSDSDVKFITFQGFLDDKSKLIFPDTFPNTTNATITYAKAELTPTTRGRGLLNDRPTVAEMTKRPDHIGWTYYATDTNTLYTWNGSNWI